MTEFSFLSALPLNQSIQIKSRHKVLCVWLIMYTFVSIITVYKPQNSGLNAVPVSNAGVCGDLCLRHTPVTDKRDKPVCTRTMFLIPVFYRMFPAPQVPCLSTVNTKTHKHLCAQ